MLSKLLVILFIAICYEDISGLWSIGIEGVGANPSNLDTKKLNDGIQNSIVFLFEVTVSLAASTPFKKPLGEIALTSEDLIAHSCFEYRFFTPIPFEAILAILVPRHLMPLLKKAFPLQHLIPVDDIKQTIVEVPWMATQAFDDQALESMATDMFSGEIE